MSAFRRDERGNFAITFGIAIIPIVGMVGVAVDYTRANAVKTSMQTALDAAALMLAKDAPNLSKKEMAQKANDYFKTAFNRPEALKITVTPDYNKGKSSLKLSGTTAVETTVTRLFGMSQIAIGASTEVVTGTTKRIEIALVLDNTGSMAKQGRLQALIDASRQFIDTMKKVSKKAGRQDRGHPVRHARQHRSGQQRQVVDRLEPDDERRQRHRGGGAQVVGRLQRLRRQGRRHALRRRPDQRLERLCHRPRPAL